MLITATPIIAYVGSPSTPVKVYDQPSLNTGSYYFSPSSEAIWNNTNGYLYAYVGGSSSVFRHMYKSDDNGATWTDGGNGFTTLSGSAISRIKGEHADCIYIESAGIFATSYFYGTSSAAESGIKFSTGDIVASNVNFYSPALFIENVGYNYDQGATAITLMDGKPVIAGSYQNTTARYIGVYFGNTANATSFTEQSATQTSLFGLEGDFAIDVHAINTTAVIVTATRMNSAAQAYAVKCDISGGFETAFACSQDNVLSDYDSNTNYFLMFSSISENTINLTDYAETLYCGYVNSSDILKYEIYDIDTETLTESGDIATDLNEPSWVGSALEYETFWVTCYNETSTNTVRDLLLYEIENAAVSSPYYLLEDDGLQSSANYPYIMTRTPSYDRLGFIYEDSYSTDMQDCFYFYVGAYGTPPPTPEPYTLWDWFSDIFQNNFMFVLGVLGLFMLFGGTIWGIQQVRERDVKQMTNGVIIAIVGAALLFGWLGF